MMKVANKFYFPMKKMRVTQNYNGKTSHYNHSHGKPADYPIDIAGVDGGQDICYAPVDMKVTAIKGVGNSVTNTIWLVSTEKVQTPTFTDYVFMAITHWNDYDQYVRPLKVGNIVKAGQPICLEGTDGATANHLHIAVGRGSSNSWEKNSLGSWVITGNCKKPEEVMYINDSFTKCLASGGIVFKSMPKVEYFPMYKGSSTSLVDALKKLGIDSNLSYRSKIAKANSITAYIGTSSQNTKMLNLLKAGKLIKA